MSDVNAIRKLMREKRNALTASLRQEASQKIAEEFQKIKNMDQYKNIGAYMAFDGEIDLKNMMDYCFAENKKIFLPKLDSQHKTLMFFEYSSSDKLIPNRFGILEPQHKNPVGINQLDIILIPLTAFDKTGHRLGMGQGYYDHTLQGITRRPPFNTPIYIGVGYAFQEVEALAPHSHDVRLDGVLTEHGLRLTKS
ncbi:MAG: 5-formyltetrahydrofolate cyclo-ligase [Gammaproteobacteria bacterium]|nr:5-formyltetrahydrofolate cyclo-ligase [Gammaproteobacteria bacterium]